jgi:hypothetical protein
MAIRFTFVIPTTVLVILYIGVILAQARSMPSAALTDEKKLYAGLNGFGGLGVGANIGGLPLLGGIGGYAGGAGGAGLHLGGNGLGGTGGTLGGDSLGGGVGGIVP